MFYVYAHKKKTDGKIFYIGKGHGNRYLFFNQRGSWWDRIAKKHGVESVILCKFDNEEDAYNYERRLIKKARQKGLHLCNVLSGGSGGERKEVYCSNGMFFLSLSHAAEFLRSQGVSAKANHISSCAKGNANSAYGFSWSFHSFPKQPKKRFELSNYKKRKIFCSNGMSFESVSSAVRWLNEQGKEITGNSTIIEATKKHGRSAYGFSWSYEGFPEKPLGKSFFGVAYFGVEVIAINSFGEEFNFDSVSSAAKWVSNLRGKETGTTNIVKCLKGRCKTAYGHNWRYK